jgi:hypothetical protein
MNDDRRTQLDHAYGLRNLSDRALFEEADMIERRLTAARGVAPDSARPLLDAYRARLDAVRAEIERRRT